MRFQWAVLNIAKEVGCIDYQKVDQKSLLDRIMSAKTEEELQRSFDQLFGHMSMAGKGTEVMSLAVKKTQSMIHEFYADGITLSEIADRLNLTRSIWEASFTRKWGRISVPISAITVWPRLRSY